MQHWYVHIHMKSNYDWLFAHLRQPRLQGYWLNHWIKVFGRIIPGEGPNCGSNFTMSFLVPEKFQVKYDVKGEILSINNVQAWKVFRMILAGEQSRAHRSLGLAWGQTFLQVICHLRCIELQPRPSLICLASSVSKKNISWLEGRQMIFLQISCQAVPRFSTRARLEHSGEYKAKRRAEE